MQEAEIMTKREAAQLRELRGKRALIGIIVWNDREAARLMARPAMLSGLAQLEDETKLQARRESLLKRVSSAVAKFFGGWTTVGKGK